MLRSAFTLIQLIITIAILATMTSMMVAALQGSLSWSATGSAQDDLTTDVMRVWRTFNDDLVQSAWYVESTTPNVKITFPTTFAADRAAFYLPYVLQSTQGVGSAAGAPTDALLTPFCRDQAGSIVFSGTGVAELDLRDADLPGSPADRTKAPSAFTGTTYQTSYYARSQELVFMRGTTTLWNQTTQKPYLVTGLGPDKIAPPTDRFPGTRAQWQATDTDDTLHDAIRVLQPTGWKQVAGVWTQRPTPPWWPASTPYGQVLEASRLYFANGSYEPRLQNEQYGQPDYGNNSFSLQTQDQLRLLGYMLVPSPGIGLGRLVRVHTETGAPPAFGSDLGRRVSTSGGVNLVIDKVISDNVVRIQFETARHNTQIGVSNVKATVYFAKVAEHQRGNSPIVHQVVTMIFSMHTDNSAQRQIETRNSLRTAGVINFSY